MGFVSRKIFPACGRMCICCPALRSRSRQPVKRYKKLVGDIFPKSPDAQTSERKIVKLCEYASKNPVRIPKITKYLEERLQKELRSGHLKLVTIVADAYVKLLSICSSHLAYFAGSVLNVTDELLNDSKQVTLRIAGCQTLARFVYSQTDGTYARTIEGLVHKVCMLAHVTEEADQESLRASSLQCLSAMIWFMTQFSHIFEGLDEVVKVTLENYESDMNDESDEMGELRHHWVDEVIRCEGKSTASVSDVSPSHLMVRPRPEKKELSELTREETESPKIWAQICIQRVAELAKESSTMRRMMEPMFVYFDNGNHWIPQQGLAVTVLSDLCYFIDVSENQQLVLSCLVRHLDHKNVSHSPITKSNIVQVATYLARQIRVETTLVDSGCVSDLCRHLRKSLQATAAPISEEEINMNTRLQNSIESCLLEIVKGMKDARPLFDYMTIALEKLPPVSVVARATIGTLVVVAHAFASTLSHAPSEQAFPEALLVQLLKAMLHLDTETRIGAHHIFHVLLFPSSNHIKQQGSRWRSGCCHSKKKRSSNPSSTFASVTALLEKLRKEKDGVSAGKLADISTINDEKSSSRISPVMDKAVCCTSITESETYVLKLSEDQIMQLLSGFWLQASLPDNTPSNYEALSHSYNLTLISCLVKKMNHDLGVRFFQLPLSLRNMSFDPNCGKLPPARRRSLYVTASAMLMFAAKMYQMHHLNDPLSSLVAFADEAHLGISEHLYLYTKNSADARQYGSAEDNHAAIALLQELCDKSRESEKAILDIVVDHLTSMTKANAEDVRTQLSDGFSLEDAFLFAPQSIRELEHIQMFGHAKEGSLDGELSANSIAEEESSISSITNFSCNPSKPPLSPSMSSIISIGQLLESAREVAGQVVGSSVSTSPLPYNIMASQCEALGSETRKKLSSWLVQENHPVSTKVNEGHLVPLPTRFATLSVTEVLGGGEFESSNRGEMLMAKDTCLSLRLPPASPFDNFLRAVSSPNPTGAQAQRGLVF